MKKNFFAKIGHFAVVGALLFNSFGVAFVHAEGTISTLDVNHELTEGEINPVSLLTIRNTAASTVNINFTLTGNSADYELYTGDGSPFTGASANFVAVPAGTSIDFLVNIIDDNEVEAPETFTLTLETATYADGRGLVEDFNSRGADTFTITDNDFDVVKPTFSPANVSITEGAQSSPEGDTVDFSQEQPIATITNNINVALDYYAEFSSDSAIIGQDYIMAYKQSASTYYVTVPETGIITMEAGETVDLYVYASGQYDDNVYEGTETATLTINQAYDPGVPYDNGDNSYVADFSANPAIFALTIEDDETNTQASTIADVTFETATSSVDENAGNVSMPTLVNNLSSDVWVKFDISGSALNSGVYLRNEMPFQGSNNEFSWVVPANSSSSLPLTINSVDNDQTLTITLGEVAIYDKTNNFVTTTNYTAENITSHTLTIKNVPDTSGATNHAPEADATVYGSDTQTVGEGQSMSFSFPNVFTDPDNDTLTYSYEILPAQEGASVSAEINGDNLVVTGLSSGTLTVTMVATDPEGLEAAMTFVLVVTANQSPIVVSEQNALLVDKTISVNEQFAINLTNLFTDAENDELQYYISTGENSDIVSTTLTNTQEGYIATFTGVSAGTTTIKLGTKDSLHNYVYADPFLLTVTDTSTGGNGGTTETTPTADVTFETVSSTVAESTGLVETALTPIVVNNTDENLQVTFTITPTTINTDYALLTNFLDQTGSVIEENGETILLLAANSTGSFPLVIGAVDADTDLVITLSGVKNEAGESRNFLSGNITTHTLTILDSTTGNETTENTAPTLSETPLQDQEIDLANTDTVTISSEDVNNAFLDVDGDTFTFQIIGNSNPNVVSVTVNEDQSITLVGLIEGTSSVIITANDGNGGAVNDTFVVTVTDSTETNNTGDTTDNSGSSNTGSTGGSSSSSGGGAFIPNTAPSAAFTTGQEVTIAVNTAVTFDASDSIDKEGDIQFYFWNFGDDSEEEYYTIPTVVHTYTETGDYTLSVRVRDTHYAESTAEVTVHVVEGNTPAEETETGSSSNTTETGTTSTEETENTTVPPTEEPSVPVVGTESTVPTENTTEAPTQETTENTENTEEQTGANADQTETDEQTVEPTSEEDKGLPTWIRILFGSGAVAAVAGAGIAINRVRRTL